MLLFKQKTAYEMRISDWSSDVCSSDLALQLHHGFNAIVDQVRFLHRDRRTLLLHQLADEATEERAMRSRIVECLERSEPRRLPVAQREIGDRKSTRLNSSH